MEQRYARLGAFQLLLVSVQTDVLCSDGYAIVYFLLFVRLDYIRGYIVGQVPSAFLVLRIGPAPCFGAGVCATAVLTLLLPLCASNLPALFALRTFMGLFESITYPAANGMFIAWFPARERTKLIAISNVGPVFGSAVAFALSGVLVDLKDDANGHSASWPLVFYVFGGVGVAWSAAWALLIYSDPTVHPTITTAEREYLVHSTKADADVMGI